jgi:uncharacterized protein
LSSGEDSGFVADHAYEQVYCRAMTMRDGRIVEITAYLDTDLLVRVLT